MTSLTSSISYMNVPVNLDFHMRELYDSFEGRASKDIFSKSELDRESLDKKKEKYDLYKKKIIRIFQKHLEEKQPYFLQNQNMFEGIDYVMPLGVFLFNLINRNVKVNSANSTEDLKLINNWNKFRQFYAAACYDKSFIDATNNYLVSLQKEIEESSPPSAQQNELKNSNAAWELLKEVISYDPDFMRVPVAILTGLSKIDQPFQISAEYLVEANNFLVGKYIEEASWVLNLIENSLKPFENVRQDNFMCFAKILLEKISFFKKIFLPKIKQLYLKNYNSCSSQNIHLINALKKELWEWRKIPDCDACFPEVVNENGITYSVLKATDEKFQPNFYSQGGALSLIETFLNNLLQVQEEKQQGKPHDPMNEYLLPCINDENMKFVKRCYEFHQTLKGCDALLQTYLYGGFNQLENIVCSINEWFIHLSAPVKRKINNISNSKASSLTAPPQKKDQTIDELMKNFQEETTKTPSRKSRRKKTKNTKSSSSSRPLTCSTVNQNVKVTTKDSLNIQKPAKIPLHQKTTQVLAYLTQSTERSLSRVMIEQANMYLQDLLVTYEGFKNTADPSAKLFYLISNIQSAYFILEGMIRHHDIKSAGGLDDHNLIRLINKVGLGLDVKDKNLIYDLFLANYWVRQPYVQLERRKFWSIPPLLNDIKEIYESKDSSLISKKTLDKVSSYIQSIPKFVLSMPTLEKAKTNLKTFTRDSNVKIFHPAMQFDSKRIPLILERCETILNRIPSHLQAEFKQAMMHLKMMNGILYELSKNDISSNAFSFLVRGLIFWQNTVLEELLEAICFFKTGENIVSHHLNTLWEKISWETTENNHLKFLKENFHNIHNISRYPFSHQLEKSSPLHEIILRAEKLRDRPELGIEDPFTLVEGGDKPKKPQELTPQDIGLKLKNATNIILTIIEGKLLPELETIQF